MKHPIFHVLKVSFTFAPFSPDFYGKRRGKEMVSRGLCLAVDDVRWEGVADGNE